MSRDRHQGQVAGTRWDPAQYQKFSDQRLRPALELLDRVDLDAPRVIYDLGCGAGDLTAAMAERWPGAEVTGVDNSRQMLEKAAAKSSRVHWVEAGVEDWRAEAPADLIYSNATLHWVAGHETLFPRLLALLNPGGCLAVQMPLSWGVDSHRLMRETLADDGSDGSPLGGVSLRDAMARKWVGEPEEYYDLLSAQTSRLDIWETTYLQVLEGEDPVFEWVKSTGLRPVLNALDGEALEQFTDAYKRRLRKAYPRRADGRTLYPFPRLFIVAVRG